MKQRAASDSSERLGQGFVLLQTHRAVPHASFCYKASFFSIFAVRCRLSGVRLFFPTLLALFGEKLNFGSVCEHRSVGFRQGSNVDAPLIWGLCCQGGGRLLALVPVWGHNVAVKACWAAWAWGTGLLVFVRSPHPSGKSMSCCIHVGELLE